MPLPRLLALSYLDKWHLLQFLGSQSWKLSKMLTVAAANCQKMPSSRAQDGCGNARTMQPRQVTRCSWSQQGNGTALLSAATLQKCLLVFLPFGPDPVYTGNRKTLFFPFLSPLTSFLPLNRCGSVAWCCKAHLPVMPAV